MMTQVTCPKCDGKGSLEGIAYANGICFCCNGNKVISVNLEAKRSELSSDVLTKAEWVMGSTEASYAKLSYAKLLKIRDFCHGGWGLNEAYPEILNHWKATGEAAFQAAQTAKLEASRTQW